MITIIAPDFKPKEDREMCEDCKNREICPLEYICPSLKRIYDEDLIEHIMGVPESDE